MLVPQWILFVVDMTRQESQASLAWSGRFLMMMPCLASIIRFVAMETNLRVGQQEQEKPKKDLENGPQKSTQIDLKCNQNSQNTQLNLSGDVVVGLESFLSHYIITFVVCQKIVFQMGVKGFRKSRWKNFRAMKYFHTFHPTKIDF